MFLEYHGKTKAVLERLGARNVRLMGSIGGDAGGALAVSMEFDDYAGYGKFTDAMLADPDGMARMSRPLLKFGDGPGSSRHATLAVSHVGVTASM